MFEIDQQNIPFVRTRQALLVLDLQNDFVSTGGVLPVETPPDFLEKVLELVPTFRDSGNNIIWIHSVFEKSRPVNEPHGDSESVITDAQLPASRRRSGDKVRRGPSQKLLELQSRIALSNGRALQPSNDIEVDDGADEDEVEETFLTIPEGKTPRVVLPASTGMNFTQSVLLALDGEKDLIFAKSYYSAFRDGTLVQILRAKFVTEIYLVGCFTNISVFATAMDAAQHGYAITIVEDGLGYRSKARHDEALRKLTEFTGCDIVNTETLIEDMQRKQIMQAMPPRRNPRRRENGTNLDGMMANLNLRSDGTSKSKAQRPADATGPPLNVAAAAEKGGSSDSLAASESPPEKPVEVDVKKRERVKSKVKTRRRHSKSVPKEIGVVGDKIGATIEKGPSSPTSVTLLGVSQALEKIPISSVQGVVDPEASSEVPDTVYTKGLRMEEEHAKRMEDFKADNAALSSEEHPKAATDNDLTSLCEGDTEVINRLLEEDFADGIFERLRDEVRWQKMSHQGGDVPRLVAVQGEIGQDGSIPIYRHPSDESPPLLPFSPTVSLIQAKVQEKLGHPVNHVLIQFYRDGTDYISEHSDKTLDIVPKTYIANVSLGAKRTMVFRTKRPPKDHDNPGPSEAVSPPRRTCRVQLPHNSMCKVGLVTNMKWLHAIRQDKRLQIEKSPEELAFDGGRISLTFRQIGTFLNKNETKIWGQGATAKYKMQARKVINGDSAASDKMLKAFGTENQSSDFDWAESYGQGFDVLHISNSPKLYLSGDDIADLRVKIALAAAHITWTEGKLSASFNWKDGSSSNNATPVPGHLPVKFVDNDESKSVVTGDLAIILYLDSVYITRPIPRTQADLARQFTRFQQCGDLLRKWRTEPFSVKPFKRELEVWNAYASEAKFISGTGLSVADYALWPILHEISKEWADFDGQKSLTRYYESLKIYVLDGVDMSKTAKSNSTA